MSNEGHDDKPRRQELAPPESSPFVTRCLVVWYGMKGEWPDAGDGGTCSGGAEG